MAPVFSHAGLNGMPLSNHRRVSTAVRNPASNHANHHSTNDSCCSGDHCHHCGCGCMTCPCRNMPAPDEANQVVYNGQGGQGIPSPANGLPDQESRFFSSFGTDDSRPLNGPSIYNSFEAEAPFNHRLTDLNLHLHNTRNIDHHPTHNGLTDPDSEDEDEPPYSLIISPSDSSGDGLPPSDASHLFAAETMDMGSSSMLPEIHTSSTTRSMSMLSSQWDPPFSRQSTSQVIAGAGAAFNTQFLRLTPDCHHHHHYHHGRTR